MADPVNPHDLDAEKAVLGAVLVAPRIWPQVAAAVSVADFYRTAHQDIFASMVALAERGVVADFVTLKAELMRRGKLDEVGGPLYLTQLCDVLPSSANAESYTAVVREKARLRTVIAQAALVTSAAYLGERQAGELVDDAIRRLIAAVGTTRSETVDATSAVRSYAAALASGTISQPVPTGYADLDDLLGGFRPSDLAIVAARPSVGKTSFALGAALSMSASGTVLFFSLEMQAAGLAERLLAWEAGVSMRAAVRGTSTVDEYAAINDAVDRFAATSLRIQPVAASVTEIEAQCLREKQERGLVAVFVDYLQLLAPGVNASSGEQAVAAISAGLKRLAKRLDVPVVALSQLSRAPEGRSDKRPQLSDLRGSGALEQDADIAILLHRQEMHQSTPENDGVAEVIVAKHRNGPTGIVRMYFDKELARFSALDMTRGEAYGQHESRNANREPRTRRRTEVYAGRDPRFDSYDGDD